jgi:hypothetical protein
LAQAFAGRPGAGADQQHVHVRLEADDAFGQASYSCTRPQDRKTRPMRSGVDRLS